MIYIVNEFSMRMIRYPQMETKKMILVSEVMDESKIKKLIENSGKCGVSISSSCNIFKLKKLGLSADNLNPPVFNEEMLLEKIEPKDTVICLYDFKKEPFSLTLL